MASPFFDLAALWQQGQQQQQNNAYRNALLQLNQQNQQLRMREYLRGQREAAIGMQALRGLSAQPQTPTGSPAPSPDMMQPSSFPQVPQAGVQMADNSAALGLIARDESGGRNIPNYRFDAGHTASGPLQITDTTWNRYAPSVGAPTLQYPASPKDRPVDEQYKVGGAIFQKEGFAPWANFNPKLAADLRSSLSPEQQQNASGVALDAATKAPPQFAGRMSVQQVAQMVDRTAGPGVDDETKFGAVAQLYKLMNGDAQQQFQQAWEMYKFGAGQQEKEREFGIRQQETQANREATQAYRQESLDLRRQQISQKGEGGGLEASKMFDVVDENGKVVRQGVMAREQKNQAGFVDSQTGQPIQLKPGEHLKQITATTSGGGRAGAQVLRQQIGGREVLSDLQNAVRLPVGTTTGLLGGHQPGTSVMGALSGDLSRALTGQDAQLMQASMASLTRELSVLMSPVYGGNYAAQQIEPLVPKEGDTIGTVLFKLARLSQSADNALEAISKSPILSNEQQEYAVDLRKQLTEAIPWTPQQAMDFARQGQGGESFGDFVKAGKLGEGGAAPPGIPQGSTNTGQTSKGRPVWKAPDGTLHVPDQGDGNPGDGNR